MRAKIFPTPNALTTEGIQPVDLRLGEPVKYNGSNDASQPATPCEWGEKRSTPHGRRGFLDVALFLAALLVCDGMHGQVSVGPGLSVSVIDGERLQVSWPAVP